MAVTLTTIIILFLAMWHDLRDQAVPQWITLGFLIGTAGLAIWHSQWAPMLQISSLVLLSDIKQMTVRRILSAIISGVSCFFIPSNFLISFAIFGIWMLWELKSLGGADVKLLFGLNLIFSNPSILIPIAMISGIQGIIALIRKQKEIPFVVSIFGGTVVYTLLPIIQSLKGG
jgi:Flp pilus assembly protein protease CpaA